MSKLICAALAAACALATPAAATVLTINPITASWSNVVGAGATLQTTGNGTATAEIRWGTNIGNGLSGYRFASAATPLDTNVVVGGAGSAFTLGTFTHFNNPINPPSISSARLTINYGVAIDGIDQGDFNAVYNFLHDETPNGASPCAFGGANNQGVNINGCADRVRVGLNTGLTEFFTIGDLKYTLDITGFEVNGNAFTQFLTTERRTNNAFLIGRIAAEGSTTDLGVPEPGTWAMMLFGFGAVGIATRRRQARLAA